jgi:adenylate cyclase
MSSQTSGRIRFGQYSLEPASCRLWAGEAEIRLTRKSAGVLGLLVERAGQPVSKEELFAAIWSGTVVSDDALTSCIQELRKALGDDARQPRYIETRHRYGYRFAAPLTLDTGAQSLAAIAVLPFTDMSPERDQSHFCEGVAEEVIDALNGVEGLRVSCRSCSFRFRDAGVDVREVGRQLAVSAVVQGSVRKAGDQLRITVQLVDAASGYHRWSRRFERTAVNVFAIQDEIAETVATSLRRGVLPSAIFRLADRQLPIADSRLPAALPRSRDFAASPPPRMPVRSTDPGSTRRLPASLEACLLDA